MITSLLLWAATAWTSHAVTCIPEFKSRVTVLDHFDRARVGVTPESALRNVRPLYDMSFDLDSVRGERTYDRARGYLLERLTKMHKTVPAEDLLHVKAALRPPRTPITVVMIDPLVLRLILIEPAAPPGSRTFTSFVERPDRKSEDVMLRHELTLREQGTGVTITSRVIRWRPSGLPTGLVPSAMPGYVRLMIGDPSGRARSGNSPLWSRIHFDARDDAALTAMVEDPARRLPLVFVSRRASDGAFGFDVDRLAMDLRGFAIVTAESAPGLFPWAADGAAQIYGAGGARLLRFEAGQDAALVQSVLSRPLRPAAGSSALSIFDTSPAN